MDLMQYQPDLLNIILEQVPMGVALFDRELILQRFNPTFRKFVEGYSLLTPSRVVGGIPFFELIPDTEPIMQPFFKRVWAGEKVQYAGLRLLSQHISFYWDISITPVIEEPGVVGMVLIMTDATDRELSDRMLQERELQYHSIFEATTDTLLVYNMDGKIVEANTAATQLYGYEKKEIIGMNARELMHPGRHAVLEETLEHIKGGEKFFSRGVDLHQDGSYINTEFQAVPFGYRGQPHALVVVHDVREHIHDYQLLEDRVEERTRELWTLLEISNRVTSTLELPPLLNEILDQLKAIVDYNGAALFLLKNPIRLNLLIYRGPIPQDQLRTHFWLDDEEASITREVLERREPVIIPDVHADSKMAASFRKFGGAQVAYMQCWIGVPLIVRDNVIGMLSFDHARVNYYTLRHARLAQTFANQVAIAIENAQLYEQLRVYAEQVEERTRELRTLLEITHNFGSMLELTPLLSIIFEQVQTVIDYAFVSILLLDGEDLRIIEIKSSIKTATQPRITQPQDTRYRVDAINNVLTNAKPVIIPDVHDDNPLARNMFEVRSKIRHPAISQIRCWMGVPLVVREQVIGILSLDHQKKAYYTDRHARLAQAFANQVAIAIENARLYEQLRDYAQQVEERTRELSTLLEMSHNTASTLELKPLLSIVLDQMRNLVDYSFGAILLMTEDEQFEVVETRQTNTESSEEPYTLERVLPNEIPISNVLIEQRQPVIIADIHSDDPDAQNMLAARMRNPNKLLPNLHCWMGVPLAVRERVIGIISLDHEQAGYYTERHARLVLAFANQVAVAIENAQLYEQAHELATLQERQRLARELHDAVTQTLFSASLIAEVMPVLWENNREEGERRLEDLKRLTRGALAEMRSLLLELRPVGLLETPLGDLLGHLTEAVVGRTRLTVDVTVKDQRILPADIQIVFYRIAQEALNNIIKHAKATYVEVSLIFLADQVELSIADNGIGFDVNHTPPDHMGLQIMHERAASIHATLTVTSAAGKGTQITIVWNQKEV